MTARFLCDEFHLHRRVTSPTLPAWKRSEKARATRQRERGAMRTSFFAVPALAALSVLPAKAEMFGPGFQPCGEKTSTLEVVECVQAKTHAEDQRLNAAYKALQARVDASTATGGATAVGSIPERQLHILRNAGWINPAGPGCRMHTLHD